MLYSFLFFFGSVILAGPARAQVAPSGKPLMPYANMPPSARPYASYIKPYQEWYVQPDTLDYAGAARSEPDVDVATLKSIKIGFLGPLDADNEDSPMELPCCTARSWQSTKPTQPAAIAESHSL